MAAKFPEPCRMSKNPVYEMVKLRKPKKCGFECDFVDEPPRHIQAKCPLCSRILYEPHQASCCGHSFFPEPCRMSKNPVYEMVKLRKPKKCGFECDFVDEPPRHIQAKCPLCSRILCEPHQASCCGHSFCRVCAEQIQADKKSCPMCNEDNFDTFHNKRLQRSLYKFQVYCTHKQQGCKWTGELGQLDKHLNLNPQRENKLEGCQYSEIECSYCPEVLQRHTITSHQDDLCPKRPFSCEYCNQYESIYDDVVQNHWPTCTYIGTQCPNKCGKFLQQKNITKHLSIECPLIVIDCDFHHVGCNVKLLRKDMPIHLKENLVTHMSLQAASHSKLLANHTQLSASHKKLEKKVTKLRLQQLIPTTPQFSDTDDSENLYEDVAMYSVVHVEKNKPRPKEKQVSYPTLPIIEHHDMTVYDTLGSESGYVEFTMHDFQLQKRDNRKKYSQAFYTHYQGYNMCVRVDANGAKEGKGSHVSVCVHLMKGEFDGYLIWPFRGEITVQLLNQEKDEKHHSMTVHFTDKTPDKYASRVIDKERNIKGWGYAKYISHDKLQPMYLKRDSLHFRVIAIIG